jgi:hypothetical protein
VLVDGLHRKFPALKGIDIEHSWWGWVDVSHDMMPRITQPDPAQRCSTRWATAATACRSRRMPGGAWRSASPARPTAAAVPAADLPVAAGIPEPVRPVRSRAFAPFRRVGQRFLYHWYYLRDERL